MKKIIPALAAILISASLLAPLDPAPVLIAAAQAANVVKSVQILPSNDGQLYSRFPTGNGGGPGNVCDVPSGWACANVGDGGGAIEQVTATNWTFDVVGSNNRENYRFAYKDAGSVDVQMIARINADNYTGNKTGFAGVMVGLRDSISQSAWFHQCRVPATAPTSVSALYRIDATNFQAANGAPGQTQPRWVGLTYDFDNKISKCWESSDGTTWTEVQSVVHDYSDVIAYVAANSNSDTVSFQGSADNISLSSTITIYNPPNPFGGAPTVVPPGIPNQIKQQGNAFSLNCASNFHDPDGDPMTFSVTGLPVGTGISMNSACQFSGSPNATDFNNSPIPIVVKADDQVDGFVTDQFTLTVTTGNGTTYGPYGSNVDIIDCDSAETSSGTIIKGKNAHGGDTILLAGGNRGPLIIRDCAGADGTPLIITNDPSDNAPTVIRREGNTQSTFVLDFESIENVVFGPDGNGAKFTGGHAGWCGVSETNNNKNGESRLRWLENSDSNCGIVVTRVGGVATPTAYIKVAGTSTKYTIQGIEIDGLDRTTSGNAGIGISANDHNIKERNFPLTFWREDLNYFHLYIHDQGFPGGGEGMYIGSNGYGQDPGDDGNDIPLRRVRIAYVLMEDISSDCLNPKYWLQGPNFVDHNHLYNCGANSDPSVNGRSGIAQLDGGDVDIHSNLIVQGGNNNIQCSIASAVVSGNNGESTLFVNGFNQIERDKGPYYCNVYNNILVNPSGSCFKATRSGPTQTKPGIRAQLDPIRVYNNTCVTPGAGNAFDISSAITGLKAVRDNIIADTLCTGPNDKINPASAANNNNCDAVVDQGFASAATDDYHLLGTDTANRNQGTANAPPVDYDGDVRPQQGTDDRGADEFVGSGNPGGGSIITIGSGNTLDCDTAKAGGVDPGDILQFPGGTRGRITISNCNGADDNPIIIRNDPDATGPTIIHNTSGGGHVFICSDCVNVTLTGLGKWSTAPAGQCGVNPVSLAEGKTQCGIVFDTTGGQPTTFIRFMGLSSKYTVEGVEIDGSGPTTGGTGLGMALQDNSVNNGYSGSGAYTGRWREDVNIRKNYVHDTFHECMYLGPNGNQGELPMRRVRVAYNVLEHCGYAGIWTKYWLQGPNFIDHNRVHGAGLNFSTGHLATIGALDGGDVDIYANYVEDAEGPGIICNNQEAINSCTGADPGTCVASDIEPDPGPFYCHIYNNIVTRTGLSAVSEGAPGNCIKVSRQNDATVSDSPGTHAQLGPVNIDHNTILNCHDDGAEITVASAITGTKSIRDNIILSVGGSAVVGVTGVNNRTTGTIADQHFVNVGADDYHLTGTSPAIDSNSSTGCPSDDYDDESRPATSSQCDQGADEFGATSTSIIAIATPSDGTFDCDTGNGGNPVLPGTILQFPGGVRGPIVIRDCQGSAAAPITIRNNPAATSPTTLRRTGGSGPVLNIVDSSNIVVDGTGKWNGAPGGECGVDSSTLADKRTSCGIVVEVAAGAGAVAHTVRLDGKTCVGYDGVTGPAAKQGGCTVKGLAIDGGAQAQGVCLSINDHAVDAASNPGAWRENIIVEHNYAERCGSDDGIGMYLGPNSIDLDLPWRQLDVRYNLVEVTGFDCVTIKALQQKNNSANNSFHHNHLYNCTVSVVDPHGAGIDFQNGGDVDVYSNVIKDTDAQCIKFVQSNPAPGFNAYIHIFNNMCARQGEEGIMVHSQGGSAYDYDPMDIDNNTVVNSTGDCIHLNDSVPNERVRNNICAGAAGNAQTITGVDTSTATNRSNTVANHHFVNPGSDDFHLGATSPDCSAAGAGAPAEDFEDDSRPIGTSDQGADESTLCP